jgi:2-polyprenyl-3-methyl-5-hydroxy-6-metoxy-1,4-benzoquinol methylase
MPPGWTILGIEPGKAARRIAETRNVKLIGHSLERVETDHCRVDVVTLLDVVEHFENPLELLSKAASLLGPDGCIVILTGNADSWTFRMLSNSHWYLAAIPEHVSVLSPR